VRERALLGIFRNGGSSSEKGTERERARERE
jgi:hypothetical protein